ncbi:hypothetical protein BU24DRAFT_425339 [Aaosphaeria arxii CBS 175.79]|uniref:Uncharacterized protein n=1 Tax=Aaosphaeria arxii CBS 175.79 TaxID=1450172 RepID=A0A6A5XIQ3_9PLEO|nr:uncharacterized protein BU24DRAFT_425339 [Aaosphaeria arxii CBS 175.79]KAF2012707.1 hypothetical protein BU24DRAFT_425339 [Aaosphaeria arxii CBS 175.79]
MEIRSTVGLNHVYYCQPYPIKQTTSPSRCTRKAYHAYRSVRVCGKWGRRPIRRFVVLLIFTYIVVVFVYIRWKAK